MNQEKRFNRNIVLNNTLHAIAGAVLTTSIILFNEIRYGLLVGNTTLVVALSIFWIVNLSIVAAIYFGWSERLKDPAMTFGQMVWAVVSTIILMTFIKDFHEILYFQVFLVVVYGTFRLRPRQYRRFAVYVFVTFTLAEFSYIYRGVFTKDYGTLLFTWIVLVFCLLTMHSICVSHARLKVRLREKNKELEIASHAKTQFLANMSHELRTPLNGVIGMSSILEESELTREQAKMLKVISTSSDNLLELINSILDFSKLDAGKLKLEKQELDLKQLSRDVYTITCLRAEKKGISYINYIDPAISPTLIGDELRLKQILLNLVSNAIKFTERGKVSLEVFSLAATEMRETVRFCVTDTGIGIDKEFQTIIFQKFLQEDITVTRKFGGTGLGLSIAHELAQLMESHIHIESEKGKGARFWFDVRFPKPLADKEKSEEKNAAKFNHAHASKKKILIVDDENTNRIVTEKILEFLGYQTDAVENGKEAIEMCEKHLYDLILMDCQMPIMNGYEATKNIRANNNKNKNTKVIALTANTMKEEYQRCIDSGMNGYVAKPVKKEVLEKVLEEYLV